MEIKGKVHCFFEQSGTFKREFIKLGIPAEDYDIQNNFGETDHVTDLFGAIDDAYDGKPTIFDSITSEDLIMAFYPCTYFCQMSQYAQSLNYRNYQHMTESEALDKIIERQNKRNEFLVRLTKFVKVCVDRKLRITLPSLLTISTRLAATMPKPSSLIPSQISAFSITTTQVTRLLLNILAKPQHLVTATTAPLT